MVCVGVTYLEEIEEIFCVRERPIIVRQSNIAVSTAAIDSCTIGNVPNFGSGDVRSVGALGTHICIAGWTVLNLTSRSRAVEVSSSTPAAIFSIPLVLRTCILTRSSSNTRHQRRPCQSQIRIVHLTDASQQAPLQIS